MMSGPKYYNFPVSTPEESGPRHYNFSVSTPEEAAGIYAQLSAFQRGVKISVVNNELQFTVSDAAWYHGADYGAIQEEVKKARKRYEENEELKRILRENKDKEILRVGKIREGIDPDCKAEKERLGKECKRCADIVKRAALSFETPFGTYDLKSELDSVIELEKSIRTELASLDKRRADCIDACKNAENKIERCSSMRELSSVRRAISEIAMPRSHVSDSIDDLEATVKDKCARLKSFVSFLNKLYEGMKNKDLMGYLSRIKQEVALIDVFDDNAQKKLETILSQLESEIALLKEKELSNAENKEIAENVSVQLGFLRELKKTLAPVSESIVVEHVTTADYTKRSSELIRECEAVLKHIDETEFVSNENKRQVDDFKAKLSPLRASVMSDRTLKKLEGILAKLHTLEKDCATANETYQKFKEEYAKYEELYVKIQGFLSADDEKDESDAFLVSPADIFLAHDNPDDQIEDLKNKNIKLTKLLNDITQESMFNAVAATVEKGTWGKTFIKEKCEDGSLRLSYIRGKSKGVIFDVVCGTDGRIGIFPRGVVLSNGKTTISPEDLRKVHSSCDWADEIRAMFASFGMSESDIGSYEEMSEEVSNALYDEKNYHHITDRAESVRYLQFNGYSQEEIESILDTKEETDTEKKKKRQGNIANSAHVDKK